MNHPSWTDIATAIATSISALVFIVSAWYARSQVKAAARQLREDQMRPYVVVDLDVSRPPIFSLYVANAGATMARARHVRLRPSSTIDA